MKPNEHNRATDSSAARKMRTGAFGAMAISVGALPVLADEGRGMMGNIEVLAENLQPECLEGEAYEVQEGGKTVQVRSVMMPLAYVLAGQRLMRSEQGAEKPRRVDCKVVSQK